MPVTATPRPRARTPEEQEAQRHSIACHALAKYCDKQAARELLEGGKTHKVCLDVSGHIDGRWITFDVNGQLQIGHDQTSARSSTPDPAHVVALLLEAVPKCRRAKLLESIVVQHRETKALPEIAADRVEAAGRFLDQLRDTVTISRRGNVRFEPAPAKAA